MSGGLQKAENEDGINEQGEGDWVSEQEDDSKQSNEAV